VEVIEPEALREKVLAELGAAVERARGARAVEASHG
jgi:hypothetical protein